jgi:hypothetical protein
MEKSRIRDTGSGIRNTEKNYMYLEFALFPPSFPLPSRYINKFYSNEIVDYDQRLCVFSHCKKES